MAGVYQLREGDILFQVSSKYGTSNYKGRLVGDVLFLDTYSQKEREYTRANFVPITT
jgi:hypothetical protein